MPNDNDQTNLTPPPSHRPNADHAESEAQRAEGSGTTPNPNTTPNTDTDQTRIPTPHAEPEQSEGSGTNTHTNANTTPTLNTTPNTDLDQTSPSLPSFQSADAQPINTDLQRQAPSLKPTVARGKFIGNYRIIKKLGQGGMGVVYEAEQDNPKRRVALKVINAGITNQSVIARFEFEAQVLGLLQHPGIASIYEAGVFDAGEGPQPFFAMEFIQGQELDDYLEANDVPLKERLHLFIQVCKAVHHAHSKGIIHRDLKPANILVTTPEKVSGTFSGTTHTTTSTLYTQTTSPHQIKILDFGIARATDTDIKAITGTGDRFQTEVGQLVGTVPYMSPEQAGGNPDELDTRSDVYALGVICYQLLADQMPYNVRKLMIHEAVRVIQEDDPKPLSLIDRSLRGDLETIVNKALAKEKDRRYQSPLELADDVRRYLSNDPISARPASFGYQVSKFARKHKGLVTSAAVVALAIVAGLVGTTYMYVQAEVARAEAEAQFETQRAVNQFITDDLFGRIDPDRLGPGGGDMSLRQLLDAATAGTFNVPPAVEANIRETMGTIYRKLGSTTDARPQLEKAYQLHLEQNGKQHPETLDAMDQLASLEWAEGNPDRARELWNDVLSAYLNPNLSDTEANPQTLAEIESSEPVLRTRINLAVLDRDTGNLLEAEEQLQQLIAAALEALGENHTTTIQAMTNLAALYRQRGDLDQALDLTDTVLRARERGLGTEHPRTLQAQHDLARIYYQQGDLDDAAALLNAAIETQQTRLGKDHPDTLATQATLANVLVDMGNTEQAEPLLRETVDTLTESLGSDHPQTLIVRDNLARLLWQQGEYQEAERRWRHILDQRRARLGSNHPDTLGSMTNLAAIYRATGNHQLAEPLLVDALKIQTQTLGPDHDDTLATTNNLATWYWTTGRFKQALPLRQQVFRSYRAKHGSDHPNTLLAANNLGLIHRDLAQYPQARDLLEPSYTLSLSKLGPNHPTTQLLKHNLAWLYRAITTPTTPHPQAAQVIPNHAEPEAQRAEGSGTNLTTNTNHPQLRQQAATLNREVFEHYRQTLGPDHPNTLTAMSTLALIYHDQALAALTEPNSNINPTSRLNAAQDLAQKVHNARTQTLGPNHPDTLQNQTTLAQILLAQNLLATQPTPSQIGNQKSEIDTARQLLEQSLNRHRQTRGDTHPETLRAGYHLARLYLTINQPNERQAAQSLLNHVLEHRTDSLGQDHPDTLRAQRLLESMN